MMNMKKLKKIAIVAVLIGIITITSAFKSDFFEVAKQIEIYTTLFKELNLYYIDEVNPAKLTDKAINNMLQSLDPYTRFYDEQSVEEAKINSLGEYSGIGIQTNFYNQKLIIHQVYEGFAADKASIRVGDEIVKIDDTSIKSFTDEQVQSLLKGAAESAVKLDIIRQGKALTFNLKREKIELNPVPHYEMIDEGIGYIPLTKFNTKASYSVKEAFVDLKTKGMQKLILDLRGNPGGLLNEAVDITNLFVPKGEVVVSTKAKLKKWSEVYRTRKEPVDTDIPLVVLIDQESASASEIVAGSLQDMDRAVIIGQRSFGKGLVQRYRNLSYGTKLKLTISKYYTPSGRNIQELDYTNRQGNNIPKFSELAPHEFQTKKGRKVYDGGGIAPDIAVQEQKLNASAKALLNSEALFNFANQYYQQNSTIAAPKDFELTDTEYNNFITFLERDKTIFTTPTEIEFQKALATANKDKLENGISKAYKNLEHQIQQEKIKALNENKAKIKEALTHQILNRYFYKKGEYQYDTHHNTSILKGIEVLNNPKQYNSILTNE